MVRDIYKDEQYFINYLSYQKKRIQKFEDVLKQLSESEVDKIAKCERFLVDFYKDTFTASYSAGMTFEDTKQYFVQYLNALEKCGVSSYTELVDVLSLMILFEMREIDLKKLRINGRYEDPLVKELENYIKNSENLDEVNSGELRYPEYYNSFYQYLCDGIPTDELISYMEYEWYPSSKGLPWYDSHMSDENIYAGYWCWLAAAVLKIKSVKHSKGKYIPVDLI